MVPREPYEAYVLGRANDADVHSMCTLTPYDLLTPTQISTCVGFQVIAQANNRFSKGLRYMGVGGVFCGRSEMILPVGVGNLQKGEQSVSFLFCCTLIDCSRYANMDYIFASALRNTMLLLVLVSYDIACQWFINLFMCMSEQWPSELRVSPSMKLIPAIPKLHEPMHSTLNHQVYSLNYIPSVGQSNLECPEWVWAGHNAVGNATKSQGPGSQHDVLDNHFSFWNWPKYIGLGKTLMRKYRRALAD